MEKIKFYRVSNPDNQQGLWYHPDGSFVGLIHDKFNFCQNSSLEMHYDKEIVGYLSAVKTLEDLYNWFTEEDILKLQEHGYYIHEFEAHDYKFYEKFQHFVIHQGSSQIIRKIPLIPS